MLRGTIRSDAASKFRNDASSSGAGQTYSFLPGDSLQFEMPRQRRDAPERVRKPAEDDSFKQKGLFSLRRQFRKKVAKSSRNSRFADAELQKWIDPGYAQLAMRLQWDCELEGDIIAIAKEARLTPLTIDVLLSAVKVSYFNSDSDSDSDLTVKAGNLPQNPGVLLSQILRSTTVMEKVVGRRTSQQLIQKLPTLLNHCPEGLAINLAVLEPLFPEPDLLKRMLRKYPRLLLASPFTVWSNLDELSKVLHVDIDDLMPLVTKHPRLLNSSPSDLNLRFRKLKELTRLSHNSLVKLLERQPALLTYFHYTLEANLINMSTVLDVPVWRCVALVLRQPSIAMLRPDSLEGKVEALEKLLGCGKLKVSSMIVKQPGLLTCSSENLERKFQGMAGVLGVSQEAATAMVVSVPALLTVTPELLQTKISALKEAVSMRPLWKQQLEAASPGSLALWVCFSAKR
eukprot:gene4939-34710_t